MSSAIDIPSGCVGIQSTQSSGFTRCPRILKRRYKQFGPQVLSCSVEGSANTLMGVADDNERVGALTGVSDTIPVRTTDAKRVANTSCCWFLSGSGVQKLFVERSRLRIGCSPEEWLQAEIHRPMAVLMATGGGAKTGFQLVDLSNHLSPGKPAYS